MTLITLLLVLILEHFFKVSAMLEKEFKSHKWFPSWCNFLTSKLNLSHLNVWLAILIILSIPVLFFILVTGLDDSIGFSLVHFILSIMVMIYCLGPIEQNAHLAGYFKSVEDEDFQAAYHHVEDYLNLKSQNERPDDLKSLGRLVTRLIVVQSNFRFFGVFFYFILLGPAGALFYRLTTVFEFKDRDDENSLYREELKLLRNWLDWFPARFTGFLYSLAGDFNGAMPKLKRHLFSSSSFEAANDCLLEETGLGALGVTHLNNEQAESSQEKHSPESASQRLVTETIISENKQALDLVHRSVVVLLVIIALMTVFGWLG